MDLDEKARGHVRGMLEAIGDNPERDGLLETPARVVESWHELFAGYQQDPVDIFKTFDVEHSQMVVLKHIEFYSMCEHHVLPFFGRATIGYLPRGRVVGISKLARLLDIYARRLQVQERMGEQIADALEKHLAPTGCGIVLEAQHLCMTARGVGKQNSLMRTQTLRGTFLHDEQVRSEFLDAVRR